VLSDAGLECLLDRTVTLCLDDECSALCQSSGLSCVRYSAFTLGAARDAADVTYRVITFVKWRILGDVIAHVKAVMFFDDDVLFLSNPFDGFDATSSSPYDLRHQAESGAGCAAQPNGGLLYMRNSGPGVALLNYMIGMQSVIEGSGEKLDQDYVADAVAAANATRCALPKRSFAGHCPRAHQGYSPVGKLVSYHAHCCASVDAKMALMARVLDAQRRTPTARMRNVDRLPLPPGPSTCGDH
jgi:Nucleotide-diphospho-sugar transferase